jgi:hypothetical protein
MLNLMQQDFTIPTNSNFARHSSYSNYKGRLSAIKYRKQKGKGKVTPKQAYVTLRGPVG